MSHFRDHFDKGSYKGMYYKGSYRLQCKNELEKIKKLKTILKFATKPHEQNIIKSN